MSLTLDSWLSCQGSTFENSVKSTLTKVLLEKFSYNKTLKIKPFLPIQGESFKRKQEYGDSLSLFWFKSNPFFKENA